MADIGPTDMANVRRQTGGWWKILAGGAFVYALTLMLLVATGNPNLFPTVVMVGSFLVPIAFVAFFYERKHLSALTMPTTALTFIYGGLLGVILASVLEPLFIRTMNAPNMILVGLIEEFAKIVGVLVIARHRRHDSEMDGLILGAAAGMGFAALESMGYAFTAFVTSNGSLSAAVNVTLLRGLLAPLGHGVWTAILAAVLFRESLAGHFRINAKVVGAYLFVALLHASWDGLPMALTNVVGAGVDVVIGQTIVAALGIGVLVALWRQAERKQLERLSQAEAAATPQQEL